MTNYIGSTEAEESILGNIINNPELIVFTKDHRENLFQNVKFRKVYRVIESMISKNEEVNMTTVLYNARDIIAITELTDIVTSAIESQFHSALDVAEKELEKLNIIKFKTKINQDMSPAEILSLLEKINNNNSRTIDNGTDILSGLFDEVKNLDGKPKYIKTGFDKLDYHIGGGLYSGLYIVGAISSLGKTTLIHQIADNIAASGRKVLYFTLEMSKKEMIAKTVVREVYKNCGGSMGTREFLNGDISLNDWDNIKISKKNIDAITNNIFFVEGNFYTDIDDIINKTKMFKAKFKESPVVIVDYLQIINSKDLRMSDKQAVDCNVAELKRLSRDLDIPVIVISSLNRNNYTSYIDYSAFKESGSIEYSADVVIGLQLYAIHTMPKGKNEENERREHLNLAKSKIPREIEVVVLKNRNGGTGGTHLYNYEPKYNLFVEADDIFNIKNIVEDKVAIDILQENIFD